ncbi:MAG: metallophosphoesterase family protein [Nitrospirae bacterium]|nr:metallophosphoesterase family protein [Nitrospirota bacterium]
MAYAVISDVHSNLHALESVLKDIGDRGIDEVYFVGDAVGYGPLPDRCLDLLRDNCTVLIAGNHDWAVLGFTSIEYFNENAVAAVNYTKEVMSDEHLEFLESFKLVKSCVERDAFFVHATPLNPENWDYLFSLKDAAVNFEVFRQKICFIGHSHTPVIIEQKSSGEMLIHKNAAEINPGSRYMVNDGSVGQPRDGDPRASYCVMNSHKIEIVRVGYEVRKTQKEMEVVGLPSRLIERLSYGY